MISTGAFLNEMDASNKQETVAEKFARVWEKKNAKAARAGGVSLMALSLAACGSSSDEDPVVEVEEEAEAVVEVVTTSFTLTDDDLAGVAADTIQTEANSNDTITAANGTYDTTDRIIDGSSDDSDVLNITTATAIAAGATTVGIETINVSFDMLTGASFDMADVLGATVNASSDRFGFDGTLTVTNQGANNVNAGTGVTDLDIGGVTNGDVDAGSAATLAYVTGELAAAANTYDITINDDITIDTLTITNATADGPVVSPTFNITATADSVITLNTGNVTNGMAGTATLNINGLGAGDITINTDDSAWLDGAATSGIGLLQTDDATGEDLSGLSGATVQLTADAAHNFTVSSDVTVLSSTTDTNGITIASDDGVDATDDDINLTIAADQVAGAYDLTGDTINVTIAADTATAQVNDILSITYDGDLVINMNQDLEIDGIVESALADTITVAGTGDLTVDNAGAGGVGLATGGFGISSFDASALVGAVTLSTVNVAAATQAVLGGTGDDAITGDAHAAGTTTSVDGGAGDDAIDFSAATAGTQVFIGGAGDDVIQSGNTAGAGIVSIDAGAGDDVVSIDDAAAGTFTLVGGAGDDVLDLGDADLVGAGAGADLTGATITVSGFETLDIGTTATNILAADMAEMVTGGLTTVRGGAGDAAILTITGTAAANALDLSGLTFSSAVGSGVASATLTFTQGGADTLTLNDGLDENLDITGATYVYTDNNAANAAVDDGDTIQGVFTTITNYDQGTLNAGGTAVATAADTLLISGGAAAGAYQGTWDADNGLFTVDADGADMFVTDTVLTAWAAGAADAGVVLIGVNDFIV